MSVKPDISVIIPVKNGSRHLEALLKGVFSQGHNLSFEVIIIDSGSTDGSLDIARRFPVSVYQIEAGEFNHGLTRNFGISLAKGKFAILLTQDAIPYDSNWMHSLVKNLESDKDVAGAYSRQLPQQDSGVFARIRARRILTFSRQRREGRLGKNNDLSGLTVYERYVLCCFDNVSSCVRKDVWQAMPFARTDFGEDVEWAKRVLGAGYKIVYEPESAVFHSHDFTVWQWFERNRINARKLCELFGFREKDNFINASFRAFSYIYKDLYCMFKNHDLKGVSVLECLKIPLFSLACAWGEYKGVREAER
jgi:rhamnosyltransferase